MAEKKKSKPIITRIKLNPEQAVLACCAQTGRGQAKFQNVCATGRCPGGNAQGAALS